MLRWPRVARRLALKVRQTAQTARDAADAQIRARRRVLPLYQVQRRLELLIAAVHDHPIAIKSESSPPPNWLTRTWRLVAPNSGIKDGVPESNADSIRLPAELPATEGKDAALARYRLFAIEQAERIVRGTAAHVGFLDPLERDLYMLREGALVDAHIASAHPGMRATLERERASALARRPKLETLGKSERDVELMMRATLASDPDAVPNQTADPADSAAWARDTATRVRRADEVYHGVPPAQMWGTVQYDERVARAPDDWRRETARPMEHIIQRRYLWGQTEADSADSTGPSRGVSERYTVRGQAPTGTQGEPAREGSQPEATARQQATPQPETYGHATDQITDDQANLDEIAPAIWYDEWDSDLGAYVKRAAGVRLAPPPEGDDSWARETLAQHAPVVRKVRQQFERLRARRTLLPRQPLGDELDLAAVVDATIDRRLGRSPDARLYRAARPARRELAIAMLMDTSGSTKAQVSDGRTILDLEKISVLLAMEALDALGDRFAAYAFAGKTAQNVAVMKIRDFADRDPTTARRTLGALEAGGFTRLGAAMRFATQELARQSTGQRLLLILSDGRPNDVDRYQGAYGVEDSRQAIMEARASGVYPYCITVDRDASEYLPRIFGTAGHTILQRAEQLPTALLGAVRALIRRP